MKHFFKELSMKTQGIVEIGSPDETKIRNGDRGFQKKISTLLSYHSCNFPL